MAINNPRKICDGGWILNVSKPVGKTSFAVVSYVRKLSHIKKVGHAGSLDPNAEGVLIVAVGKATKKIEQFVNYEKEYVGRVRFGIETDTFDSDGSVISTSPVNGLNAEKIEQALQTFSGTISQVPPRFSALKYKGRPMYEYARRGEIIEPEPRDVNVYDIRLESVELPDAVIRITCSRGTYIRSIAHDLGQMLGCGAILHALTRERIGDYHIRDALKWHELPHMIEEVIVHKHENN